MKILCINVVHATTKSEALLEQFLGALKLKYPCRDLHRHGEYRCDFSFSCFDCFPQETIQEVTDSIPADNDIFVNVVSVAKSTGYAAMHSYERGRWRDDLEDNPHIHDLHHHNLNDLHKSNKTILTN